METRRYAVDDILNIAQTQVAVNEILKGTFDDEIKRVNDARAELAKVHGAIKSLDEAQEMWRAAEELKASAQGFLDSAKADSKRTLDEAANVLMAAKSKARQVEADAATLVAEKATNKAWFEAAVEDIDKRETALAKRENAVTAREAALSANEGKLQARVADFNKRLDALKAPA